MPGAEQPQLAFGAGYGHLAPATRARHLATLRSSIRWWRQRGWLDRDPTDGWARRRTHSPWRPSCVASSP